MTCSKQKNILTEKQCENVNDTLVYIFEYNDFK